MRLDTTFRLSFYITLGLACTCLAQAEAFFMLWFAFACVPLAVLVFVLAWRHEGEWVIQETASNYLGICIGLAAGAWILVQLPRSEEDLAAAGVPWPAGLLPHVGVLLLALLAVKLFRPKLLSDFWVIQTIGLMVVTLACVLAGDPVFAGLLFVYLVSLVWCLTLFQLYRADRPAHGPLFTPGPPHGGVPLTALAASGLPWRQFGLRRSLHWSLAVLAIGLTLFLVMPRNNNSQWVPQKLSSSASGTLAVGVEPGINLNRVGTIELSPAPAFHVNVLDERSKPAVLGSEQLWRVDVLDYYVKGHWMTYAQAQDFTPPGKPTPPGVGDGEEPRQGVDDPIPAVNMPRLPPPPPEPAAGEGEKPRVALGGMELMMGMRMLTSQGRPLTPLQPVPKPGQRYLRFQVRPPDAGGLVVAEPLDLRYVGINPRVGDGLPTLPLFYSVPGGDSVLTILPSMRRYVCAYTQVIEPGRGVDRQPVQAFTPAYREHLLSSEIPYEVVDWARLQVKALVKPERAQLDSAGHIAAEHHKAVSEALCRYLCLSGDYKYTLNLTRKYRTLDATADFLQHVKSGHCERFAGALALSLRALGIPSRIVKGYRGAEEEQPGKYVVRLDHAHSWVQALVPDGGEWIWLTLDPTPGQGEANSPLNSWLAWVGDLDYDQLWRRFVLNYNGDSQWSALHYLGHSFWHSPTCRGLLWQVPSGLTVVLALVAAWRRRRRLLSLLQRGASSNDAPLPAFYRRVLQLLARRLELQPQPGQTPREFAAAASAVLAQRTQTAALSAVPLEVVDALYRLHFAGLPLAATEQAALERQVATLAAAL